MRVGGHRAINSGSLSYIIHTAPTPATHPRYAAAHSPLTHMYIHAHVMQRRMVRPPPSHLHVHINNYLRFSTMRSHALICTSARCALIRRFNFLAVRYTPVCAAGTPELCERTHTYRLCCSLAGWAVRKIHHHTP